MYIDSILLGLAFATCFNLFLPEFEWDPHLWAKPALCQWLLVSKATDLWNVLLLLPLLSSKCSGILGAFLDITVKTFSARWDLIHANSHCGREGCWLMKQPVESGTAEVVTVPSWSACLAPGITASRARTSAHSSKPFWDCRCVAHCVRTVQIWPLAYLPPLGCKLRWFLEPRYFWSRDPCVRGSLLQESGRAGRGVGTAAAIWFSSVCVTQRSPWPQGSALCE